MNEEIVIDTVPASAVRTDGGTQSRLQLNESVVDEYAHAIHSGQQLPPLVVFFNGSEFWLADGFHRYHAYVKAGVRDLPCEIRTGTLRDAKLFSVGANASHGLRRTNEDKRHAVATLLQDAEWSAWSDNQIAKACGVTHPFVATVRKAILKPLQDSQRPAIRTVTRNGTTFQQKTKSLPAAPAEIATLDSKTSTAETLASPPLSPCEQECPPSEEEIAEAIAAEQAERARILAVLDSGDPLGEALKANHELSRLLRATEERLNSVLNNNSQLVRQNKALRAKLDKLGAPE